MSWPKIRQTSHRWVAAIIVVTLIIALTWGGVALLTRSVANGSAETPIVRVDNPFGGASWFVNPAFVNEVKATYQATKSSNAALGARMESVARYPTAIWMDGIDSITGANGTNNGVGLAADLNQALSEVQGSLPEVVQVVIYDMPGRDCAALASNGTLPLTKSGLNTYEHNFINPIAKLFAQPRYARLRIAAIIEPDSLPNLVTNASSKPECGTALSSGIYEHAIEYDLSKFHQIQNVYSYLDIGHSGWLGWPTNMGPAVQLYTNVAKRSSGGLRSVAGFITDTANYIPVTEPYLNPADQISGQPVDSATFYQYDPDIDEAEYTANLYQDFTSAGWPSGVNFLIDTSRDGWGGPNRPTRSSTSTDLNTFVDQSKIDRRPYRGLWCNQAGAGIGYRPIANPSGLSASHVAAFVWIKPPGESDGAGAAISNSQGKHFDPNCSSTYQENEYGYVGTSNALPNAPLAGDWFNAQFTQLVSNAYPPIAPYKGQTAFGSGAIHSYNPSGLTSQSNAQNGTPRPDEYKKGRSRSTTQTSNSKSNPKHNGSRAAKNSTSKGEKSNSNCYNAAGHGYWHTKGNQILDSHNCPVRIAGVNWYGFETPEEIAHGLWSQSYQAILNQFKADGYNTVRLPYSNQMIQHPIIPQNLSFSSSSGQPINAQLKGKNSLQDMITIIDYATSIGLKVILDQHRSNAGESASSNGLWYNATYSTSAWIQDWVKLAKIFANNQGVIGADLHNEPHTPSGESYGQGATWGTGGPHDWRLAAEQAGNAILKVQPKWLIFVEGIGENPDRSAPGGMNATWWGGDLQPAAQYPVKLDVSGRLVYSAHDYGPVEFQQAWFNSHTTKASLDNVWNAQWGYLYNKRIAPIFVGEFGTGNTYSDVSDETPGSQGQWFSTLVSYLKAHPWVGWTYWAANGEDSYGLLNSSYSGITLSAKQHLLAGIQFHLFAGNTSSSRSSSAAKKNSQATSGQQITSTQPNSTSQSSTKSGSGQHSPSGSCAATLAVSSQWSNQGTGGFIATVTITAGRKSLNNWRVTWTWPAGQKITSSWNVALITSGSKVTGNSETYNATVPAGGTQSFGFQGTWHGSNSLPRKLSCS